MNVRIYERINGRPPEINGGLRSESMKRVLWILAVVMLPVQLMAEPIGLDDERIQNLSKDGKNVQASEALIKLGAPAVSALTQMLDEPQNTGGKMADHTLLRLSAQAAGTDRQDAVADALAEALGNRNLSTESRRHICRYLSVVGGSASSIDALKAVMNDPEVGPMAIWALGGIPTRDAALTLLAPVLNADSDTQELLLAAIASNPKTSSIQGAVGTFYDLTRSAEPSVQQMAVELLGTMPFSNTLRSLGSLVDSDTPGSIDATLNLAELYLDHTEIELAEKALGIVTAVDDLPVQHQCAILHVQGRLGTDAARDAILNALGSNNMRVRAAALDAATMLPGPQATAMIGKVMAETDDTALKIALLEVLGKRGETMADPAAALIKAAATHTNDEVKIAAIRAMESAQLISPAVSTLILITGHEDGPVRDAAIHALHHLNAEAVTPWMIRALPDATPRIQATLLDVLGKRGGDPAIPAVLQAATSEKGPVRTAAFRAIGHLQATEGFNILMKAFRQESGNAQLAAEEAMLALADEEITQKLIDVYADSDDAQKPSLLRVLGQRNHPDVAKLLSNEVKNDSPDIRAAALANLWRQDSDLSLATLVAEAKRGPEAVTKNAVLSMLKLAQRVEKKDKSAALDMYAEALDHAVTAGQKSEALQGIARTIDPQRVELLSTLTPYLQQETFAADAARAAGTIALKIPKARKDEAIPVLRQVVRIQPDDRTTTQAIGRLRQLGEDIDPAREAGFITTWWLIGPYPNPENAMWDKAYMPEKKIDLDGTESVAGEELAWKKVRTDHLKGIVNLEEQVEKNTDIGAYAYAEIHVDDARKVKFKMGSDDSIVLWINGERVHGKKISRGLKIDEDVAEAKLKEGRNTVLAKILQGAHAWEFVVRVTDMNDRPLPFTQKD